MKRLYIYIMSKAFQIVFHGRCIYRKALKLESFGFHVKGIFRAFFSK